MKRLTRVGMIATCLLGVMCSGCGDKGTTPAPKTKIVNQLGYEYYGEYEIKSESGQCGFMGCTWWNTNYVDTIIVCVGEIDFLPIETNADEMFFVDEERGVISDTLIDATYVGRTGILIDSDTCMARFEIHFSSKYAREDVKEITPNLVQFFMTMRITECGTISVVPVRFTLQKLSGC